MHISSASSSTLSLSRPYSPSLPLSSHNSISFNNGVPQLRKQRIPCSISTTNRAQSRRFSCRAMFGLGVPEIVVIAGVTTLLFGPKKLPQLGRSIGQAFKSFQKATKEFETELRKEAEPLTESPLETLTVVNDEEKQGNISSTTKSV